MPEIQFEVANDEDRDTYYLNMGPQHPSTHGVLRLRLKLDGEEILEAEPVIGYSHRAHEKMAENRNYFQWFPNTSRMDYLCGMIYNIAYCEAIEKIASIECPERAQYIRIIANEMNRLSSHLLWYGTFLLDLGGFTPFLYCFDDREKVLDLLDHISGSRLTYSYGRFGGVAGDVDEDFLTGTKNFCNEFIKRLHKEYHPLVTENVIFQNRTKGVGYFPPELARESSLTGPSQRAMGEAVDVRKDEPYGIYDQFDFDIPTRTESDCFARYMVRCEEMEQSVRIILQAIDRLPDGPYMIAKPPKKIKPPKGDYFYQVESGRGRFGMYIVSDGNENAYRIHCRTPSFANLSAMRTILPGTLIADTVAILGSLDIVLPEIDR